MSRLAALAVTGAVIALTGTAVVGCGSAAPTTAQQGSGSGTITVWAHDGQPQENAAVQQAVTDYNNLHTGVTVKLTLIPQNSYTQTITSTPAVQLPDVFEFDGPTMASDVFAAKLSPLGNLVSANTVKNQTVSVTAQDTYQGSRYGLSIIDSGLALYGNKQLLDTAKVTYPTAWNSSWTADQFQTALQQLAAQAPGHRSLDIQENTFPGEWATFGFLPIVNSTGSQLIKNNSAKSTLTSPAVIHAIQQFASWKTYIDPDTDGNAFTAGRVALSWVGHWEYPTFSKALGSNLVLIPLPSFGAGAKTGQGSWAWGISATSRNGAAAGKFLDYLLSDKVVAAYTNADGAPPGTTSVLGTDPLYRSGGPLNLYTQALQHSCGSNVPTATCIATPRPVTPAYPVITDQFSNVIENALKGGDVSSLLGQAADAIDRAYQENDNYQAH